MKVIKFELKDHFSFTEEISLCLGYFDGLHRGHFKLVSKALSSKYKSALLTFDFDNNVNLKHKRHVTSIDDKIDILNKAGLDYLFILKFNGDVMNLTPSDFIERIIIALRAKEVVIGEDYHFGKMAAGDYLSLIENSFNRYNVIRVEELKFAEQKIGTSSIIKMIENGDVSYARDCLGRFYSIRGKVKHGYGIGRYHKYPTANIDFNDYVIPLNGVYAVKVEIDGVEYKGFANIGKHPTINELTKENVEVHIFDFDKEIYDKEIIVSFVEYIRAEKKFKSLDDLYLQLKLDELSARDILSHNYGNNKAIPFFGVRDYIFNRNYESYFGSSSMDNYYLIGADQFSDNHYIVIELEDLILYFDKDTRLLKRIDIVNNIKLLGNINIGDDISSLLLKESSLQISDYPGIYVSNSGYIIEIKNEKINKISLYEKKVFENLTLYNFSLIKRKVMYKNKINEYIKIYKSTYSDSSVNELVNLLFQDIETSVKYLKESNYIDLLRPLSVVIEEKSKYFDLYKSNEKNWMNELINLFDE